VGRRRARTGIGWQAVTTTAGSARPTRSLRLRGGPLDGSTWSGRIDIGGRVCCGAGAWSPSHVYVVTGQVVRDPEGEEENVAVPAEF